MEIRLLVSEEINEMEDTLYLDFLHIKDEYKSVSISIMSSKIYIQN